MNATWSAARQSAAACAGRPASGVRSVRPSMARFNREAGAITVQLNPSPPLSGRSAISLNPQLAAAL